jgi:pimeloyl-ACP methyl ester carboxylesterase
MSERLSRIVFVHGSVTGARPTWNRQRSLRDRFELDFVQRPGFPPLPDVDRVDFVDDAALVAERLGAGAHLVGHSYGAVISLLAAAEAPERVRSLTVIEPPATSIARGNPAADRFTREGEEWWQTGPTGDPEAFLRGFLVYVGSDYDPPSPLPPSLAQGARTLIVERGPWEAEVPLDTLAAAPFPKLVVSGDHHEGFDAVCDVLVSRLGAERLVLPGHGHAVQQHRQFNDRLADFVSRANRPATG